MASLVDMAPVVLDPGSGICEAGVAGDDGPRAVFPTLIGRPRHGGYIPSLGNRGSYVGEEARSRSGIASFRRPIERGIGTNWDGMERIVWHVFDDALHVSPEKHAFLHAETPLNPRDDREKMVEMMFETFKVPAFQACVDSVLSLYALTAETCGIVLDSGDGVTHAVPVYEGHCVEHAVTRLDVAGKDVTEYLGKCLSERGCDCTTAVGQEVLGDIKEKMCYVSMHFEEEMQNATRGFGVETQYEMPDGEVITIGSERFRATEALFQPTLVGIESPGIDKMTYDSISKCDIDIQRDLYGNIAFSGGTTMLPCFEARVRNGLVGLAPEDAEIQITASPDRMHSAWAGGSVLASLSTFDKMCITKEEYEECGAGVVHRKCL